MAAPSVIYTKISSCSVAGRGLLCGDFFTKSGAKSHNSHVLCVAAFYRIVNSDTQPLRIRFCPGISQRIPHMRQSAVPCNEVLSHYPKRPHHL